MKLAFFAIAAAMILATVLLLAIPLWRGRNRGLAIVCCLAVPLAAIGLYLYVGQPATLNGVPRQDPAQQQLADALQKLETHLQQQPKDTQGWLLLGQTMTAIRQPQAALDAYQHALENAPDNVIAMVGWAEMSAMIRPDHQFDQRASEYLRQAVKADPNNQRALWLLGISAFQHGQFAEAIHDWTVLQPMLAADSEIAHIVSGQIRDAQQQLGAPSGAATAASPAAAGPGLTVKVSLSPALQHKLQAQDTVFIFARAPEGPPMPLAALRLPAASLPRTVNLTDAMAMLPQHRLSQASAVIVGARISHSGQALAAPGDLEGHSATITLPSRAPVSVLIDTIDP